MNRRIEIRWEGPNQKPLRLYWAHSDELAVEERFATFAEAGAAARDLMEEDEEFEAEHAAG